MHRLSENYYARQCYLNTDQVPTQSVMKKAMQKPLAEVYFKSMNPKLRLIAGLDPPLKGGDSNWHMPPEDLLRGRSVLKPIKKEHLSKLNYIGIDIVGMNIYQRHQTAREVEKDKLLQENDQNWQQKVKAILHQRRIECSEKEAQNNTNNIRDAVQQFSNLYRTSILHIENLIKNDAVKQIEETRNKAFTDMQNRYEKFLKQQAIMLNDHYTQTLLKEKEGIKASFIENLEILREQTAIKIHDLNVEKYVAVEKLRQFLECQKLACQVYVAMKEREECAKEMHESRRSHETKMKTLKEKLNFLKFDLHMAKEKEKAMKEYEKLWKKKVCEVLKKFEMFVLYTVKELPEHADFFLNVERLLLLQISQTLENPSAESIFVADDLPKFSTPVPRPHPYYLFCDRGYKPHIEQHLCPKHCTSSASQLPVIIINKRCIYSACDNFDQFTEKITQFVHRKLGDDADFEDYYDYEFTQPVKYRSSNQHLELNLQGSLVKLLQQEIPTVINEHAAFEVLGMPRCYCNFSSPEESKNVSIISIRSDANIEKSANSSLSSKEMTKKGELEHEREPKWGSYLKYVKSKKCDCAKLAKEHLASNLPPYMRRMSRFEAPELPNYKMCPVTDLKSLVKKRKGTTAAPLLESLSIKIKDAATQCDDPEIDFLCTCFSDEETRLFLDNLSRQFYISPVNSHLFEFTTSLSHLDKRQSSFLRNRALSLIHLLDDSPEIREIFQLTECT